MESATFHYHHVYVPLLIRLCNDVETNPGPTLYDIIDATTTVCADFSQGGRRFGPTAGKQCVAMSLTAIVHSQIENVSTWNSSSLNSILENGNGLYMCISKSINKDLLLLTDVPAMVSVYGKIYDLQYSEPCAGGVFIKCSNAPYMSLDDSFKKIFLSTELNYNYAMLTISCSTVSLFKISDVDFKIFDSHSRDHYKIPHPFGKCILLTVSSIQHLVAYFQNVSYVGENDLAFEIVGEKISFKTTEPLFADSTLYKHLPKSQQNVTSRCEKNLVKRQLVDRK